MKTLQLTAKAEIYEEPDISNLGHPYLTYAKFVFTDDKPNGNKQGVKAEDFDVLAASAVDMPVKMRYVGKEASVHEGAVVIGHIKDIEKSAEDGINKLVAIAALYSEEKPIEVKYLKKSHKDGNAPEISWELGYDYDEVENGVTWKRGAIAKAATFVRRGAYGTRAKLLALASLDASEEEIGKQLHALAEKLNTDGGNTVEKEQEYLDKIKALEARVAELEGMTSKGADALKTAEAELKAKDDVIQQYETQSKIETRTRKIAEAGLKVETDPDKLKTKQDFWVSLPEEAFEQYVADLKAASETASTQQRTAFASLQSQHVAIPRPSDSRETETTIAELAARMRQASRGQTVASE